MLGEIGVGMCICHRVRVSVFMPVADSIGQGVRIDRQHLHSGSVGARGTGSVGDSVGEGVCAWKASFDVWLLVVCCCPFSTAGAGTCTRMILMGHGSCGAICGHLPPNIIHCLAQHIHYLGKHYNCLAS